MYKHLHLIPFLTCSILLVACSGGLAGPEAEPQDGPPQIGGLGMEWNHDGTATVSWTTDAPATSRVDYGLSEAMEQSVDGGPELVTDHLLELRGLLVDREYFFSVRSTDLLGRESRFDGRYLTESEEVGSAVITGRRTAWHPITISFAGPWASETDDAPNPFLDYRLTVTFTGPSGQALEVPGFFDGDGEGGGSGSVWRVRMVADEGGEWSYEANFVSGEDIAINLKLDEGTPTSFHGATGSFVVNDRDPAAEGFYRYGKLAYIGEHYLKFEDGPYFIKGGTDSPENLLGYAGFDNTFDQPAGAGTSGLTGGVHRFADHVQDWEDGDPLFVSADTGYDSKGIIGALNYLSSQGVNSVYFLPMNLGGDGRDTTPCIGYGANAFDRSHYDISKLRQWNTVFEHAQRKSILLHFVLAETESGNEQWFDGGVLGAQRRLFYREMVARFGHALAIKWNLSEENDYSTERVGFFAYYIRRLDPYDHPIAFHTHILQSSGEYAQYEAVLGDENFDATSIQGHPQDAGKQVELWRQKSADAGRKWVVETDEQTPASTGLTDQNAEYLRRETLYDVLFSGGHIEWYAGYHSLPLGGDMRMEDFRTREAMWQYMRFARELMESELPFWEMEPADQLLSGEDGAYGGGEVFAKPGEAYAIYLPSAATTGTLDLSAATGQFQKRWFDPREGRFVGDAETVSGGGLLALGDAPADGGVAFQERNGLLVIECESAPASGDWRLETAHAGFTGDGYYRWAGPDYFSTPGNGVLRYEFEIGNAGLYQFRIHNRHDNPASDLENDCWVRMDGGSWIKVFSNTGAGSVGVWNWESRFDPPRTPAEYQLSAGRHTIEISGRSANFKIDRMHLYLSGVSGATDPTQPESPVEAGTGGSALDWVLLLTR